MASLARSVLVGMCRKEETLAAPYGFGGSFVLRHPQRNGRVGTRARLLVVEELNPLKPLPSALAPEEELPYPFGLWLLWSDAKGMTTSTVCSGTRKSPGNKTHDTGWVPQPPHNRAIRRGITR